MASVTFHVPKYRHYKPKDLGVVRIAGRDIYLGKYGSPESKERYRRVISEWLSNDSELSVSQPKPLSEALVSELIIAYWKYVEGYYVKNGVPTSEATIIRQALHPLRHLYTTLPVASFGPTALKAVRDELCRKKIRRGPKKTKDKVAEESDDEGKSISRGVINRYINKIRGMFRWGVENELVPAGIYEALQTVAPLRKGRTDARETAPILPVSDEHIDAVLPKLSPIVAAMVRLQRLTGARPQEIMNLRPIEIEKRNDGVWVYQPGRHKTEHHGRQRIIVLGPKAQEVLKPWLDRDPQSYCFSPAEADAWSQAQHKRASDRKKRKTNRSRKARPPIGDHYTRHSYRVAIQRACRRAKVPIWSPNQLRHTRATELRAKYGLEAARTILGHSEVATTEIYAERDLGLAVQVSKESG